VSPRIFVVDDDRTVRFVLAEALRDAGFAVQAFDSADAALAALGAGERADLVFTDVRMPAASISSKPCAVAMRRCRSS
jgi:two-component system nitrogen regulation response regulator GlnG